MKFILKKLNLNRDLNFLYLSFFLFACSFGINNVIFPTNFKIHGAGPAWIGSATAFETLAGIITAFFLSKIIARFHLLKTLLFSTIFYSLTTILLFFYVSFWLWIMMFLVIGSCYFIYTITRISWLNILLKNNHRGVGIGLFSMIISFGNASGPVIVKLLGANNIYSFIASAILTIGSFCCLLPLKKLPPKIANPTRISLGHFYKKNPQCFLARFFMDFQAYTLKGFTVIYGVSLGYSYENAGLLITAYYASGFFDLVVGFLLKKNKPDNLINIGFAGCLLLFISLIFFHHNYWFVVLIYFILGAFIACIFVAVYKMMNEDYSKDLLISAGATFQLIGTLGAISGSIFGGLMGEFFGIKYFPVIIAVPCIIYLGNILFYEKKYSFKKKNY